VDSGHPRRQRVAAYGVLTKGSSLLLTRLAPHVAFQGWTLPGGGVEHGEDPRAALRREVYEEAGLHVTVGRVLDVHSTHFTGARPDGMVEDYHGLHLIFAAALLAESFHVEPSVVEVDGSTDLAAWVELDEVADMPVTDVVHEALGILGRGTHPGGGEK
jgi:ADP-ribose pyrophosphatase YjhB (NUDIX family)